MSWKILRVQDYADHLRRTVGGRPHDSLFYNPTFVAGISEVCQGVCSFSNYQIVAHNFLPMAFVQTSPETPSALRQWGGHFGLEVSRHSWVGLRVLVNEALRAVIELQPPGINPVIATTILHTHEFDGLGEIPDYVYDTANVNDAGCTVLRPVAEITPLLGSDRRSKLRRALDWFKRAMDEAGYSDFRVVTTTGLASAESLSWQQESLKDREIDYIWPFVAAAQATAMVFPERVMWVSATARRGDAETRLAVASFVWEPELGRVVYTSMVQSPSPMLRPLPTALLHASLDPLTTYFNALAGDGSTLMLDMLNGIFPGPSPVDTYKHVFYTHRQNRVCLAAMRSLRDWPYETMPVAPYLLLSSDGGLTLPDGNVVE